MESHIVRTLPMSWRAAPRMEDIDSIGRLLADTGYFRNDEILVGQSLIEDIIKLGHSSDYKIWLLEGRQGLMGYTCFGQIPLTRSSYDLYWIAVAPNWHGCGVGRSLLQKTEESIISFGGTQIFAETSASPHYYPTRQFYHKVGFEALIVIDDFYGPGDGKVLFRKKLEIGPEKKRRDE